MESTQTREKQLWSLRGNRLFDGFLAELGKQKDRLFLWVPVFIACGVGMYFSLKQEIPVGVGAGILVCAAALLFGVRQYVFWRGAALALLLVCAGFFAGQVRTASLLAPTLERDSRAILITGTIEAVEDKGDEGQGSRLVLGSLDLEDISPENTPRKARISIRNDSGLKVGQRIRVLGKLHKPSPPTMPGGFDFRRYLYFQGIGAVGFAFTEAEVIDNAPEGLVGGWPYFQQGVERLRQNVSGRIERSIPYPQAGIAMALVTGRKTAIAEDDVQAMRGAGLAHMLAISGLHVGLFSGALFFVIRLFLAFVPGLALHYPVKKYAALVAILGAAVYMFLAGATTPTQRALLMVGAGFIAIILDRSPLSLRLVAFAASVILLLFPESLLSAGFHMSFAAVTALIVFYDSIRSYWSSWHRRAGVFRRLVLYFAGVSMTTVIATVATAPFSLFHFQNLAVYSLIANILAVPVLAFVIMPAVLLSLVLMPFGAERLPLMMVDIGTNAVLDIAHRVSSLPYAVLHFPVWPLAALVLFVLSALWLCLWKGRLSALAVVPLCVGVFLVSGYRLPDILVSPDADLIAVYDRGSGFYVSDRRKSRFVRESWKRSYGLEGQDDIRWPREGRLGPLVCGEAACRITLKRDTETGKNGEAGENGGREEDTAVIVSVLREPGAIREECAAARVVISPYPVDVACAAQNVIDLFDAKRNGAYALWLEGRERKEGGREGEERIRVQDSLSLRGNRPWSR